MGPPPFFMRFAVRKKTAPVIRTRRLLLRPIMTEDAARIAAFAGDWDVARMTARIPYPYTPTIAHHWIDDLAEGEIVCGIDFEGDLVGLCGYMPSAGHTAEIGYWIAKPWWRRGFATEAVRALVAHCFGKVRIKRLVCGHFVDNEASARVIAKLGFRPTGRETAWCEARRAEVETLRYERLRPFIARLGVRAA